MRKYNVLWFDDECSSLNIIKEKALLSEIHLHGVPNAKDGIEELERNLMKYDAAIVDGKFHRKPGQSGDSVDDNALLDVAMAVERISVRKKIPWFILSGQTSFTKETNKFAEGFKNNKVYDKTNDQDLNDLWSDLKAEADQQEDTQILNDYRKVFEVCTEEYVGIHSSKHLLAILKKKNAIAAFDDPDLYFNPLRKVVEDLFHACNKWGLLPDVFIKGSVALNESSRFLSGSVERGYQLIMPVFPKVVSDNVKNILSVCQPAAHRSEIDAFISEVNSPYLLLSITYQLLDVLLWFKLFVDKHKDVEQNKTLFKQIESGEDSGIITGIIQKDRSGNYHCGDIILTYRHISDHSYKEGDNIRIVKTADNTKDTTKHLYSRSALNSEKVIV